MEVIHSSADLTLFIGWSPSVTPDDPLNVIILGNEDANQIGDLDTDLGALLPLLMLEAGTFPSKQTGGW